MVLVWWLTKISWVLLFVLFAGELYLCDRNIWNKFRASFFVWSFYSWLKHMKMKLMEKGKLNPLLKPGSFAVNPFSCHKSSILNKYRKWLHTLHSQQCQFSSKIGSISPFKMFASYIKNTLKHHEKYIQTCQINVITLSSRWIGYKWYMCFVSKAFN